MIESMLRNLPFLGLTLVSLAAVGCSRGNNPITDNPGPGIDGGMPVLFAGAPTVGQAVPNPDNPDAPGKITRIHNVISTNTYLAVTVAYPPAWNCPSDWASRKQSDTTSETSANLGDGALAPSSCQGVANLRRSGLKAQAQSELNLFRANRLSSQCAETTRRFCTDEKGTKVDISNCSWSEDMGGAIAIPSTGAGGTIAAPTATTYSTTNTQVATVDEADYVKNDGNTIFVLTKTGLRIIDAWPAAQTKQVGELTLPGEPRRLFFDNNRLVVYTRMQNTATTGAGSNNPSSQGCTYGYSCRFDSEGGHTLILVYDVSTPATPKELIRYELSGGYMASRRVGSFIYSVLHDKGAPQIPGLDYVFDGDTYESYQANYLAKSQTNTDRIDQTANTYFHPWMTVAKPGEATLPPTECTNVLAAPSAKGTQFLSLVTFDLTKLSTPTRTFVASRAGYVFASPTALYLAVDRAPEQEYLATNIPAPEDSVVHKFRLEGTQTNYAGSAVLPGHILNQFAMDEYNGVLRVASTKGWVLSPDVSSSLSTYREQAGKLSLVGQVNNLAPGEDIRAVRFDGDQAYLVTFKSIDPLFVFDLADPAKPAVKGELKIPGFSTYMQKLDATHLLTIGFDTTDLGSAARFDGIQIQIFDVADLANPKLAWKTAIGTRGTGSEALSNHLAFNYFAPKKILALPITICEGGGNGNTSTNLTFAGLMVFDVSVEKGITEHGRLSFVDSPQSSATDSCNQWWTDAKSLVKRSIFMDDFVYGLSDTQLRVANLSAMSTVLQSVPLSH